MGYMGGKVGELTMQLRQQAACAAAEFKKLVSVLVGLETRIAMGDSLIEAWKVIWKEFVGMRAVVVDQKARLDATCYKMVESRHCRNDDNASTASCRKDVLHMQKVFGGVSQEDEATFERVGACCRGSE